MLRPISATLLVFAATFAAPAFADETYRYEPASIELTGRIRSEVRTGPPNYGENSATDRVETILILTLETPISVIATEGDAAPNSTSYDNVSRIQLTSSTINLEPLVDQAVRLSGKLFEGHTGHHYTNVLMTVEKAWLVD